MSNLFTSVIRQAFKTFDRSNQGAFPANLALLKQLTDQLTFRDMQLSQQKLLNEAAFNKPGHAPCTFIHIFENDVVSMSVFIMRAGYTMPLHDHPMMHGILRGIYGQLRVQSYTQQFAANEPVVYDRTQREVRVVAEEPLLVGPETESAVLTPRERNFHEITALGGLAAFFDILSPPYDAVIPVHGSRRCRFYRPTALPTPAPCAEQLQPHMLLELIPPPVSYYCDCAEAPESVVQSTFICSAEAYSAAAAASSSSSSSSS